MNVIRNLYDFVFSSTPEHEYSDVGKYINYLEDLIYQDNSEEVFADIRIDHQPVNVLELIIFAIYHRKKSVAKRLICKYKVGGIDLIALTSLAILCFKHDATKDNLRGIYDFYLTAQNWKVSNCRNDINKNIYNDSDLCPRCKVRLPIIRKSCLHSICAICYKKEMFDKFKSLENRDTKSPCKICMI